ncbi:MAG TPA: hypothetical protein VN765_14390, partial [Candidatus Acidoferrum sp.]|nr:hypothetical protein [Candidatus Acidoferrum sp.]
MREAGRGEGSGVFRGPPFFALFRGKLVRLAGLEPAVFPSQDCRLRVIRCLSLPTTLRHFSYEIKGYFASLCSNGQEILCKTRASLLIVQNLCKIGSRAGICAKGVQIPIARRGHHFPFRAAERARSVKASASGIGVHEGLPSGAGLGRREARRRGLGTAAVPNDGKTAEPLPVEPCECFGFLTIEDGDFGLWRDTNQAGFGLNTDTNAKKGGELAGLLGHGHNGGTLA